FTASWTAVACDVPRKATCTSCALPFGARCAAEVCTDVTRGMSAEASDRASAATSCWSATSSRPPSARFTTKSDVAPDVLGKTRSASFWALADSYELGRKLAWSELDTDERLGASGTITATAAIQTAITLHGCAVTILPSRANIAFLLRYNSDL